MDEIFLTLYQENILLAVEKTTIFSEEFFEILTMSQRARLNF